MGDERHLEQLHDLWWAEVFSKLATAFPAAAVEGNAKKLRFRTHISSANGAASFPFDSKKRVRTR